MRWAWWAYGELWFWWNIELDEADRLGLCFLVFLSALAGIGYLTWDIPRETRLRIVAGLSLVGLVGSIWDAYTRRKKALGRDK